jgi:hypothetical protein
MRSFEIYLIFTSDYWYVGSTTVSAQKRRKAHEAGYGRAPLLASKMQELGPQAFSLTILEEGYGDPIEAEQRWYDWYLTNDPRQTLNMKRPDSFDGWNRGKSPSQETRVKISQAKQGHTVSEEARAKISIASKGKPKSETHRAALSAAHQGKTHTAATRAKMSATRRGKKKDAALRTLRSIHA